MSYIDFHSHILPGIDDGAKNVEMALAMAKECQKQNIGTIFCTPHYYHSSRNSVDDFLKVRRESYVLLKKELEKNNIDIDLKLGAEVNFNCDLSEVTGIEKLAYEGTDYILIEMPYGTWQESMFDYLYKIGAKKNLTPIIAHAERYCQDGKIFKKLEELDVFFQVNASSFLENGNEKKHAVKLLKDNKIHLIGTDMHNLTSRKPELEKGFSYIKKKTSPAYVKYLKENGIRVLNNEELEKNDGSYSYNYFSFPFLKRFFK